MPPRPEIVSFPPKPPIEFAASVPVSVSSPAVGVVVLDRLVPPPEPPHRDALPTAIEASAALVAALNRTQRVDDLTLRGFHHEELIDAIEGQLHFKH